jgi:hypothetical protein
MTSEYSLSTGSQTLHFENPGRARYNIFFGVAAAPVVPASSRSTYARAPFEEPSVVTKSARQLPNKCDPLDARRAGRREQHSARRDLKCTPRESSYARSFAFGSGSPPALAKGRSSIGRYLAIHSRAAPLNTLMLSDSR